MEWQKIETALKDGTEIEFMNSETGQYDKGYWHDYTKRGGSMTGIDGEWDTVLGNGDMTHWRSAPNVELTGSALLRTPR